MKQFGGIATSRSNITTLPRGNVVCSVVLTTSAAQTRKPCMPTVVFYSDFNWHCAYISLIPNKYWLGGFIGNSKS